MGSRMITAMVIAIAFFMIGSDVTTAQFCGADLSELKDECQRYLGNAGPPSGSCCSLIRPIDVPCACQFLSGDLMNRIDMNKVVYVARSCGKNLPSGYKCGSYTIPAA